MLSADHFKKWLGISRYPSLCNYYINVQNRYVSFVRWKRASQIFHFHRCSCYAC